jgi:hypothetical protein
MTKTRERRSLAELGDAKTTPRTAPRELDCDCAETPAELSARLAKRREVRRELAKLERTKRRAAEAARRLAALDAEADAAADRHRQATAPLQEELAAIEARIVDAIADRKPVPPNIEDRRDEILNEINAANIVLSDEVERVKRLRQPLAREFEDLRMEVALGAAVENKLGSEHLANPALHAELAVCTSTMQWAINRHEAAQKRLNIAEQQLKKAESEGGWEAVTFEGVEISQLGNLRRKVRECRLEFATSAEAVDRAQRECVKIRKQIIDE